MRIVGFDLARAYAIFGMFIVNFTFCFGSFGGKTWVEEFQFLFIGNATSVFIICAGIGLSLMTNKVDYSIIQKKQLKSIILKRSWFLFALGLILYSWWPGDILHFYGGYMHIAIFILFTSKRYYLLFAVLSIVIFHFIMLFIPIETGWDYVTTEYKDFWTLKGFLRNTFYNGWNSIFPWIAFFLLGMWLGKLDWKNYKIKRNVFLTGLIGFILFRILRAVAQNGAFEENVSTYILSDYSPVCFPFMAITASCALMTITICLYISEQFSNNIIINSLSKTGRMTLTFYVFHITVGMLVLSFISKKKYTGYWGAEEPLSPWFLICYSTCFFLFCVLFSTIWNKKFKLGPLEYLMRVISNDYHSSK